MLILQWFYGAALHSIQIKHSKRQWNAFFHLTGERDKINLNGVQNISVSSLSSRRTLFLMGISEIND